jgi:hypothetical protein
VKARFADSVITRSAMSEKSSLLLAELPDTYADFDPERRIFALFNRFGPWVDRPFNWVSPVSKGLPVFREESALVYRDAIWAALDIST